MLIVNLVLALTLYIVYRFQGLWGGWALCACEVSMFFGCQGHGQHCEVFPRGRTRGKLLDCIRTATPVSTCNQSQTADRWNQSVPLLNLALGCLPFLNYYSSYIFFDPGRWRSRRLLERQSIWWRRFLRKKEIMISIRFEPPKTKIRGPSTGDNVFTLFVLSFGISAMLL